MTRGRSIAQYDHALALDPARLSAPEQVEASAPRGRVTPLSPERYAFQCTFDQETHDLLQDVRALMSHDMPSGEAALVIKGALKLAKAELMKRKAARDRSSLSFAPQHVFAPHPLGREARGAEA